MVNYKSIIGIYTYVLTLNKTYLSVSSYLKNENNLVIQKADKGNTIVILDKDSYLKSVETLLKNSSKFKNIPVAPNKDLNYIINSEKESLIF